MKGLGSLLNWKQGMNSRSGDLAGPFLSGTLLLFVLACPSLSQADTPKISPQGSKEMTTRTAQQIEQLKSQQTETRSEAAKALAMSGIEAKPAAVPLVLAAGEEEESIREWAVAALEELGTPLAEDVEPLLDILIKSVKKTSQASKDQAFWAVTLLGRRKSERALPHLAELLKSHPSMTVRQRIAWALGEYETLPDAAIEALHVAEKEANARLSYLAKRALEKKA
ncbi:HEAT repeat domain-containing protein [Planctomycetales bacterium 10988]|nr:HEAT repeat domain-containing protein [Planctomycetales bacterium 10988]